MRSMCRPAPRHRPIGMSDGSNRLDGMTESGVVAPRALAIAEEEVNRWIDRSAANESVADWVQGLKIRQAEVRRLRDGGIPRRPGRRMPSLASIARFNNLGEDPYCMKCWYEPEGKWRDANGWLERAHVIDRVFNGLDNESNLRPLCSRCHRSQPIFEVGQESEALKWFATPWWDDIVVRSLWAS